jgi:hypothetical protein
MVQNFMHWRFAPAVDVDGILAAAVSDLPEHRRGRQTGDLSRATHARRR